MEALKGWFKSKTGASDSVAQKIASQFRSLAQYADFEAKLPGEAQPKTPEKITPPETVVPSKPPVAPEGLSGLGLVYRLEIHLPDTQNVETFRAIFRALREELIS